VSHDRYFLDNLVSRVLEIRDGRLHEYTGNYSYFIQKREAEFAAAAPVAEAVDPGAPGQSPAAGEAPRKSGRTKEERRLEAEERNRRAASRKEMARELRELEAEIVRLEAITSTDQALLCDPEVLKDSLRIKPLMQELKKSENRLKELYPRWEKLMHGLEELEAK